VETNNNVIAGFYVVPEYTGRANPTRSMREEPMCVLVAGWKTQQFMCALMYEMDRGQSQLPRGSHVTFFNEHSPECDLLQAFDLHRALLQLQPYTLAVVLTHISD
jgi:hypothetical protein